MPVPAPAWDSIVPFDQKELHLRGQATLSAEKFKNPE
jgi:hypothetical protein